MPTLNAQRLKMMMMQKFAKHVVNYVLFLCTHLRPYKKTNVVSYGENNIWDDYWIDNISRRMRWAHEHESINKTEW